MRPKKSCRTVSEHVRSAVKGGCLPVRVYLLTIIELFLERIYAIKSDSFYLEGVLSDGFNDLLERHFGGESVSVVDDRFAFISVPAVELHAATALVQGPVGNIHTLNPPPQSDCANVTAFGASHYLMYGSVLLALVTWSLVR